jgi:4-hydroxybenzoate polyprenyltransferase
VSFSLTASATYILNDLFDVASDRAHPRKRSRTFAAGLLSPQAGLALSGGLLAVGFGLAIAVAYPFALVLLVYLLGTTWYSVLPKRYVLIDVVALVGLYTVRLFAGAVPIGITLSFWLMAFSTFVFFSLAPVKQCSELIALREAGRARSQGRDYQSADLAYLIAMGIASGYASVLVLALFINSPDVALRYTHPQLLWFICALLLYWLSRLWIKTGRNEMHDDPIVFTLHDRGSRYVIGAAIVAVVLAL